MGDDERLALPSRMLKIVIVLSLVTAASSWAGCKRPGTDRSLQCERYAELEIERLVECGGSVEGVTLTPDNATALSSQGKAACMTHETLSPTHECLKQLKAAPCDGKAPKSEAMPACIAAPK